MLKNPFDFVGRYVWFRIDSDIADDGIEVTAAVHHCRRIVSIILSLIFFIVTLLW